METACEEARDFPRLLAPAVRAMPGTATIRRIEPSQPDPIYAAIERHRAARKDLDSHCGLFCGVFEGPECKLDSRHCMKRSTEPTTIAGAVALFRYAASKQEMTHMRGVALHDPGVLAEALAKIGEAQS
jgi:hypothetical protein